MAGDAVLGHKTIHVADVQAESDKYPEAAIIGHRTILAVPLMRADEAIGVIVIRRTEVRPFSMRILNPWKVTSLRRKSPWPQPCYAMELARTK